jgi:hypothetical protein
MDVVEDSPWVTVRVYCPGNWVGELSCPVSAKIRELDRLDKDGPYLYLYNGQLLQPNHTFKFYKIGSSDVIIALGSQPESDRIQHWRTLTNDSDIFREQLACLMNPKIALESARLRDLRLMRINLRDRTFRKFVSPAELSQITISDKPPEHPTVVSFSKPTAPSVDPLPCNFLVTKVKSKKKEK